MKTTDIENTRKLPYLKQFPDENGYFGKFGGSFVPENVAEAMQDITTAYHLIAQNSDFIAELRKIRKHFQGRPTPIYFAHNLTKKYFSFSDIPFCINPLIFAAFS